jgi:hypothetical protein
MLATPKSFFEPTASLIFLGLTEIHNDRQNSRNGATLRVKEAESPRLSEDITTSTALRHGFQMSDFPM